MYVGRMERPLSCITLATHAVLAVVAQIVQIANIGPGLCFFRMSGSASGCKRPASSISQEGSLTEAVPPASAVRRWFYASLFIILQEEEWSPMRAPAVGNASRPQSRAPDQRLRLPRMLERALLVVTGHEWRRGFTCWMGRTRTRHSRSSTPRFRCPFRLPFNEGRLVFTKARGSVLSIPRSHVRAPPFLEWAITFSSDVARTADPDNLPSVRSTAIHINGSVRRQRKDNAVHYFRDYTSLQTLPYTLSRVGPRLILCSGHAARPHWSQHSFYRAGFSLMPLLANGQELGRRCSYRSCALRRLLLPTRDWGAFYRRPTSPMRRAGKRSSRRRRHRPARLRHSKLAVRDLRAHMCLSS